MLRQLIPIVGAEHEFFRSLGLAVHASAPEGMHGWARVHASCDYSAPLRYQDEVEVHLVVAEKGEKSLTYEAVFRKIDGTPQPPPGSEVARARWTVVCVSRSPGETRMRSVAMPPEVDEKIQAAPPEALNAEDG